MPYFIGHAEQMDPLDLSVIIITKNEAHNVVKCLSSVAFAQEIIVFDCGSTDGTQALCRQFTPLVFETDWPGDGPQKNRALSKATCQWVLCLDADEQISKQLADEIKSILPRDHADAYTLPFISSYLGKPIRFGDWRNEKHCRLFKREHGQFSPDKVHCHLQVRGKVGQLKHPVYHAPFVHLEGLLDKMNLYSTQSAQHRFERGKKADLLTAFTHSFWTFFRGYFLKLGFLDGKEGLLLAISNAQGTFYRYLKLFYLNRHASRA